MVLFNKAIPVNINGMKRVGKILLIDDLPAEHRLFREALTKTNMGIEFSSAYCSNDAYELLTVPATILPDIIFLSLNMVDDDGCTCLTVLKAHPDYRNIPVVIYTSSNLFKDVTRAQELGASWFLVKSTAENLTDVLSYIFYESHSITPSFSQQVRLKKLN